MTSQTSIVAREVRLHEWADMIRECRARPAGMTVDQWCSEHSITKCDYYYRMKAVRKACLDALPAEVREHPVVAVPAEIISCGNDGETHAPGGKAAGSLELVSNGITVRVGEDTPMDLLARVLGVIPHA